MMVKNPPSNAGDGDSILGQGTKNLHAGGQLSLYAITTEPMPNKEGYCMTQIRLNEAKYIF